MEFHWYAASEGICFKRKIPSKAIKWIETNQIKLYGWVWMVLAPQENEDERPFSLCCTELQAALFVSAALMKLSIKFSVPTQLIFQLKTAFARKEAGSP